MVALHVVASWSYMGDAVLSYKFSGPTAIVKKQRHFATACIASIARAAFLRQQWPLATACIASVARAAFLRQQWQLATHALCSSSTS
jgi:hypothetical protein